MFWSCTNGLNGMTNGSPTSRHGRQECSKPETTYQPKKVQLNSFCSNKCNRPRPGAALSPDGVTTYHVTAHLGSSINRKATTAMTVYSFYIFDRHSTWVIFGTKCIN